MGCFISRTLPVPLCCGLIRYVCEHFEPWAQWAAMQWRRGVLYFEFWGVGRRKRTKSEMKQLVRQRVGDLVAEQMYQVSLIDGC